MSYCRFVVRLGACQVRVYCGVPVVGGITGGRKGALIGAGVGALAVDAAGYYMDRQEARPRR